jgi:hypothetical protein
MSRIAPGSGAAGGAGDAYADIVGPPAPDRSRPVARHSLRTWEESASLSPPSLPGEATLAPLTRFLGVELTAASPAWSRDPMPGLRRLQKRLVEYSLSLEEGERGDSMAAILVVEQAVRWSLRLQQMEPGPGESPGAPGGAGAAT